MRKSPLILSAVALLSYFPAIVSRYKIFYIAVFVTFWWTWSLSSRGYLERQGMWKDGYWFFTFFAYLLLTASWAQYPVTTLLEVAIHCIFLFVWGLSYVLVRNYSISRVARIFVAVPYVVAATYAYMYVRFGAIRPFDEESATSIGSTGNMGSLWLGISLPFILWLIVRGDKNRRIELYLALLLIAVSQSRAGYVLAIVCLAAHVVVSARSPSQYVIGALKACTVVLAVLVIAFSLPVTRKFVMEGAQRVMVNTIAADVDDTAITEETFVDLERVWMFEQGWAAFTEHPALGIGFGNISKRIEENYGIPVASHNLLLTLIAESGWPAFIIFIVLMSKFFKRMSWARAHCQRGDRGFYTACTISMVATLLASMAHPILQFPLFYVILAIGDGAERTGSTIAMPRSLAPQHLNEFGCSS